MNPILLAEPSLSDSRVSMEREVTLMPIHKGLFLLSRDGLSHPQIRSYFPDFCQLPSEGSSCFDFCLREDDLGVTSFLSDPLDTVYLAILTILSSSLSFF